MLSLTINSDKLLLDPAPTSNNHIQTPGFHELRKASSTMINDNMLSDPVFHTNNHKITPKSRHHLSPHSTQHFNSPSNPLLFHRNPVRLLLSPLVIRHLYLAVSPTIRALDGSSDAGTVEAIRVVSTRTKHT
jgi:hypothetical protein